MEIDPIIKQAIEIGIKLGIEAYRNERNANLKNKTKWQELVFTYQ